jgi:hypothetical protein
MAAQRGYYSAKMGVAALGHFLIAGCAAEFHSRIEHPSMDWGYQGYVGNAVTAATLAVDVNWERVNPKSVLIRQLHYPCFGTCPSYSISIWGDGQVDYYGANFVRACGARTKRISVADVEKLTSFARDAGFFWSGTTAGENCEFWTDSTTIITRVDLPGYGRSIRHYLGETCFPEELRNFELAVPRIAGVLDWIGKDGTATWCESDNQVN